MSAFAAAGDGDKAKSLLDEAYRTAVATEFDVDYDTTNTSANDITVFTDVISYKNENIITKIISPQEDIEMEV